MFIILRLRPVVVLGYEPFHPFEQTLFPWRIDSGESGPGQLSGKLSIRSSLYMTSTI